MNFIDKIKGFNFSKKILESTQEDIGTDIKSISKRLTDEIGGVEDESIIDSILDDITYEILNRKEETDVGDVIKLFSDSGKLKSFSDYKNKKSSKINNISKNLNKISKNLYSNTDKEREKSNNDFIRAATDLNLELDRANKLVEIYKLNSEMNPEEKDKIKELSKSDKVFSKVIESYKKLAKKVIDHLNKKVDKDDDADLIIDDINNTFEESGISIININIGGKETTVKDQIEKIKVKEDSTKPKETKNQRLFIKDTITRLKSSNIPELRDGLIIKTGGFYNNILNIQSSYKDALLNIIQRRAINLGEDNIFLDKENADVKYQISYLETIRYFLDYMIDSYISTKRDRDKLKRLVNSLYVDKAAYIRNKNLSRKINMTDFAGLKIKREIKIPLYKTVNIPITNEDIVANSKFSKFKAALGNLGGLLGWQKSYVDQGMAKANKMQNRAILQAITNVSKSIAGAVGGDKARNKTDLAARKVGNALNLELKEDMLAPMDSGGANQPGAIFDTPQSVAGGMDTFSKLGPGKVKKKSKRKKKKKKANKRSSSIISFNDFINKNKY